MKLNMKRRLATASTLVILILTTVLLVWMLARVAEQPGLPRDVGELPTWFAGGANPAQKAATPSPTPVVSTEESTTDKDYMDVMGNEVEIALKEYKLVPDKIRVRPGTYTFVLRNGGRFSHDFHIQGPLAHGEIHGEGYSIDVRAAKFGPGRTVRLEVTLTEEGEYHIMCPLSNHDERGMNGILLVTSKLQGN